MTEKQNKVEWLLNYRGGSFLIDSYSMIENECKLRGIVYEKINASILGSILAEIESNNMDIVLLEKKPKIAVYAPPGNQPCLLYTSPSPRDRTRSRMPSSA